MKRRIGRIFLALVLVAGLLPLDGARIRVFLEGRNDSLAVSDTGSVTVLMDGRWERGGTPEIGKEAVFRVTILTLAEQRISQRKIFSYSMSRRTG